MRKNRLDLSDWLIHFIHDRKPENDPNEIFGEGDIFHYPFSFPEPDKKRSKSGFDFSDYPHEEWHMYDERYPIEPDASAFAVLLKILNDGHIRAGWSFRNNRPTIYGYWPAVCFTEMPLYALFDYVNQRRGSDYVDSYAICLRKKELFRAGARPVIYGLSGKHLDNATRTPKEEAFYGPRILDPKCGIGIREQYRYVAMNLSQGYSIDWSHEREWRWSDTNDKCSLPGLPLFGEDEPFHFSEILILTQNEEESARVLNKLKELFDAGRSNQDYEYYLPAIQNAQVICVDEVRKKFGSDSIKTLRLDDLPKASLKKFKVPNLDPAFLVRVQSIISEANQAAKKAVKDYLKLNPGGQPFDYGWVWLEVHDSEAELTQALLQLNLARSYGGLDGYHIEGLLDGVETLHQITIEEVGIKAAKEVLQREFPSLFFHINSRDD